MSSDDGVIRKYATGATRDSVEGKLNWEGFISPVAMRYFAEYMHEHRKQSDGNLRDGDNWQKGFKRADIMDSLIRHVWDVWYVWRTGGNEGLYEDTMIDLLCAILFNSQAMLLEISMGRDVQDGDDTEHD